MQLLFIVEQEIAALERALEQDPLYVKLKALRDVRDLYRGTMAAPEPALARVENTNSSAPARKRDPAPLGGKSLEAVNVAVEILQARRQPMRTAELMPLIAERGITFAGDAPQNIISSLLSRSSEVVSKGGHVGWALKAWESEESSNYVREKPSSDFSVTSVPVEPGKGAVDDNMN